MVLLLFWRLLGLALQALWSIQLMLKLGLLMIIVWLNPAFSMAGRPCDSSLLCFVTLSGFINQIIFIKLIKTILYTTLIYYASSFLTLIFQPLLDFISHILFSWGLFPPGFTEQPKNKSIPGDFINSENKRIQQIRSGLMTQFLGPGIINNLSMYGGGYGGGYGNYSSYGGYSGMGSSYGGYGGLSSSYGSSYGSYGGLNRTASINQQNQNQPNNADPNQPPAQPINQRKLVIEEYFKMMGGLRSMVEIGFSMVALCNFTSRSWELLKKIVQFLVQTSKKLYMKLAGSHILTEKMSEVFEKAMLISPNSKNGNTLLNKVLMAMRITAAIILMVGIKLKSNLNKEVETEHEEILKKYEQIKLEQAKLQEHQNTDFQGESAYHKQGYF